MERRNLIVLVILIETIFMCISVAFVTFYYDHFHELPNHDALFAGFAIIVVSAAETAVILALLSRIYRKTRCIMIKPTDEKKEKI
jgi:NADH:ubiquinone oxidoreductase subunit K